MLWNGCPACTREGSTPHEDSRENKGHVRMGGCELPVSGGISLLRGSTGKCPWLAITVTRELKGWAASVWGHSTSCHHLCEPQQPHSILGASALLTSLPYGAFTFTSCQATLSKEGCTQHTPTEHLCRYVSVSSPLCQHLVFANVMLAYW